MQLQHQSHTVKAKWGKKPTTLLHLTVWSQTASSHCLAHENQSKATTTGPAVNFKLVCINHKAETSKYTLYLQSLPNGLWGGWFQFSWRQQIGFLELSSYTREENASGSILVERFTVYHGRTSKGESCIFTKSQVLKCYSKHLAVNHFILHVKNQSSLTQTEQQIHSTAVTCLERVILNYTKF